MKFDHIGIFVKNLKFGRAKIRSFLDIVSMSKEIKDPLHRVIVQFLYDKNDICYELVAPYKKNNPVDQVIKSKKNIINHIAYKVKNFDKKINYLKKKNCILLGQIKPAVAFHNSRIAFFLTSIGIILEIIEDKNKKVSQ